jgi:hypothetical protein
MFLNSYRLSNAHALAGLAGSAMACRTDLLRCPADGVSATL